MSAIGRFHYARNCQTHFNSCTSIIRVVVSSTVRNCTHQNSFFFRKELVNEFINFWFIFAFNCVMFTEQKMKFSIKETADLVSFTKEILTENLHFLCSGSFLKVICFPKMGGSAIKCSNVLLSRSHKLCKNGLYMGKI